MTKYLLLAAMVSLVGCSVSKQEKASANALAEYMDMASDPPLKADADGCYAPLKLDHTTKLCTNYVPLIAPNAAPVMTCKLWMGGTICTEKPDHRQSSDRDSSVAIKNQQMGYKHNQK